MEDLFNANPNVWDDGTSGGFETGIIHGMMDDPMVNAFAFVHELLPSSWLDDAQKHFGLSDSEIVQSVKEASAFFDMDNPLIIHEYRNTGVFTNLPFTDRDDVLVFNREQMQNMGITDKDGFDLVMTHECTHRMLQGDSYQLSPHQEELCCDFMSGVRAGLNNMDITQVENALADQPEGSVHPIGSLRVDAIHEGQQYAEHYMAETGHAPTFKDCLDHFRDTFHENHFNDDSHDDGDGDIKKYTQSEIDKHVAKAENDMRDAKSRMEYYSNWIRKHGTDSVMVSADKGLRDAQWDYEHAKAELSKWKNMHPDSKGFAKKDDLFDSDSLHNYTLDELEAAKEVADKKHSEMMSKLSERNKYKEGTPKYKEADQEYEKAKKACKTAQDKVTEMAKTLKP